MAEKVLSIGESGDLVAIMTEPQSRITIVEGKPFAVLLMNAGLVHHVGPSRVYVKLARKLSQHGFYVVRFDFSGIGDSGPRKDKLPADRSIVADTLDVMNHISKIINVQGFICIGLCSGAAAAFKTAVEDDRIKKVVLINTLMPDTQKVAQMQSSNYYWKRAINNPKSWLKFFLIRSNYRSIWNAIWNQISYFLAGSSRKSESNHIASEIVMSFRILRKRRVNMLLIFGAEEIGEQYFIDVVGEEYRQMKKSQLLVTHRIEDTDHMVTPLICQEKLISLILDWI